MLFGRPVSLYAFCVVCTWMAICCPPVTAEDEPTVMVALLVRNKAHTLPYFFRLFEELDYPKHRMTLWIFTEDNQDQSVEIIKKWKPARRLYNIEFIQIPNKNETTGPIDVKMTQARMYRLMQRRQEALYKAKQLKMDYIWFLDCDVFLSNPQVLKTLIATEHAVVAPMLATSGEFPNFWPEPFQNSMRITERKEKGCHEVPMVHTCMLINLKRSETRRLKFVLKEWDGKSDIISPEDDFFVSLRKSGTPAHICNQEEFGVMMPASKKTIEEEYYQLTNAKQLLKINGPVVPHHLLTEYEKPPPEVDNLGIGEHFIINLDRRPERAARMEWALKELGFSYKRISAVDGKTLNDTVIKSLGIRVYPKFIDPVSDKIRHMTMGEIGCALSHYFIWQEIVDRNLDIAIIFEDDAKFLPNYRKKLARLFKEAKRVDLDWDLMFLGRKKQGNKHEPLVEGSNEILEVDFSYWLVAYALTAEGARKLLRGDPLNNLIPVDEYVPVMYDKHPDESLNELWPDRDVKAFSPVDLLIEPQVFKYQPEYVSDTSEGTNDYVPDPEDEDPSRYTRVKKSEPSAEKEDFVYKPVIVDSYYPRSSNSTEDGQTLTVGVAGSIQSETFYQYNHTNGEKVFHPEANRAEAPLRTGVHEASKVADDVGEIAYKPITRAQYPTRPADAIEQADPMSVNLGMGLLERSEL